MVVFLSHEHCHSLWSPLLFIMFAVLLSHGHYYVTIVNRHDSTWWWCFYHMGITLVMVVHHVGNGGAFIAWALRFIVIAITIQHVCGAFIAWALLWSQCFRKMSHRRLSDITIVNRHDWTWWWCFYRMGITLVMVVLHCDRHYDSTCFRCFYRMGIIMITVL